MKSAEVVYQRLRCPSQENSRCNGAISLTGGCAFTMIIYSFADVIEEWRRPPKIDRYAAGDSSVSGRCAEGSPHALMSVSGHRRASYGIFQASKLQLLRTLCEGSHHLHPSPSSFTATNDHRMTRTLWTLDDAIERSEDLTPKACL